jgi:RimJ/RimL family protein N-acetyltransferase
MDLKPLDASGLALVLKWFDDQETQDFLGGRSWPLNGLALVDRDRHILLASENGEAVALIDVEIEEHETTKGRRSHFALVVDPLHRRQGVAQRAIRALLERPDLCGEQLCAGVHEDNAASHALCKSLGFIHLDDGPDSDGYRYYGHPTSAGS